MHFEHAPNSTPVGSLAACRGSSSQSPDVPNSLGAGENAGNFADSAFFRENESRKHSRIQQFAAEFPTRPSRELIRASRESTPHLGPEQGISRETDPRDPTHIKRYVCRSTEILANPRIQVIHDLVWLASPRPLSGSRRRLIVAPQSRVVLASHGDEAIISRVALD